MELKKCKCGSDKVELESSDFGKHDNEIIAEKDKEIEFLKMQVKAMAHFGNQILYYDEQHKQAMLMLKGRLQEILEYHETSKLRQYLPQMPSIILHEDWSCKEYFEISKETSQFIMKELGKARQKHPNWPTDPVYAAAIVAEESGELVQAVLNRDTVNARKEAAHVVVTAIRFLEGK